MAPDMSATDRSASIRLDIRSLAPVAVGVFIRLAAILSFLAAHGGRAEVWEYEEVASNLLAGRGLLFRDGGMMLQSRFLPLFPLLCAGLHRIGGPGFLLFYVAHLACAAGVIVLTSSLATRFFDERTALLAAWLAALEPGLIVYQSYKVHVVAWAALSLLGAFVLDVKARQEDSPAKASLSGLVCGLGMLSRFDVGVVLAAPLAALSVGPSYRRNLLRAAALAAGVTVALAPWVWRNYRIHDRLLLSTSQSGEFLWRGNNPESTGTLWNIRGEPISSSLPPGLQDRLKGKGELDYDLVFRAAAIDYIRADPTSAVRRWGRSFLYFWWFAPDYSGSHHYSWAGSAGRTLYKGVYLILLSAAFVGSVSLWRRGEIAPLVLWLPPFTAACLHSVTFVEGRHRLLVLPCMLVLAAHGFSALTRKGAYRILKR